jgi:hypothetical protein
MDLTKIDLTSGNSIGIMIMAGVGSALLALLTGKTIRRLLLLPLKLLAAKTKTHEDDLIVEEAARDLGLAPDSARPVDEKDDKNAT